MYFVIHATDKQNAITQRAKFFREHRIHLDQSATHGVSVLMAGPLVADDGETPVGSLFVLEAKDRAAVDAFTRSDPYCKHGVWERIDIHYFNKKRG